MKKKKIIDLEIVILKVFSNMGEILTTSHTYIVNLIIINIFRINFTSTIILIYLNMEIFNKSATL